MHGMSEIFFLQEHKKKKKEAKSDTRKKIENQTNTSPCRKLQVFNVEMVKEGGEVV